MNDFIKCYKMLLNSKHIGIVPHKIMQALVKYGFADIETQQDLGRSRAALV